MNFSDSEAVLSPKARKVFVWSIGLNLVLLVTMAYGFYNRNNWVVGITGPYEITQKDVHAVVDSSLDDAGQISVNAQIPRPMDRGIYDPMIALIGNGSPTRDRDVVLQIVRNMKDSADLYDATGKQFTAPGTPSKEAEAHLVAETLRRGAKKLDALAAKK